MKKLLTLIIPEMTLDGNEAPPEAEILSVDTDKPLFEAIKQAKGKYCLISDGDVVCDLPDDFFKIFDNAAADIIAFNGSYCIKTAVLKSVPARNCRNKFCAEIFACCTAKTVLDLQLSPFSVLTAKHAADENESKLLSEALDEFKKKKEKLNKDVYAFTFDLICERLCAYYADALIAGRKDSGQTERLKAFDAQLKDNVVLYLALEKRFKPVSLQKLRKKNFKLGLIEYSKLKKSQKNQG